MLRRSKFHRPASAALGVTLALALSIGVAACGDGSSPSSTDGGKTTAEQLDIWYVNPLSTYPAWDNSNDVFKNGAGAGSYTPTVTGPERIDVVAMVDDIERAIVAQADGIITCTLDEGAMGSVIRRAQDAGIVVVTLGCVDRVSDFAIGTDNETFGRTAADQIAARVGDDAQVGIITTDRTTPNQVTQVRAFEAQLRAAHPGVKVVAWESDKSDPAAAAQKITAMTSANPDMNALWCVEGTCPGAAEAGLKEAGKKPGDVYVLGIDDADTTIAAIRDGWVSASINQCYFIASSPLATDLIRAKKAGDAPARRFWPVAVDVIDKARLPYAGCPADAVPPFAG